jgi:hypothetical protein
VLHAFDAAPLGISLVEQKVRQDRFDMDNLTPRNFASTAARNAGAQERWTT